MLFGLLKKSERRKTNRKVWLIFLRLATFVPKFDTLSLCAVIVNMYTFKDKKLRMPFEREGEG